MRRVLKLFCLCSLFLVAVPSLWAETLTPAPLNPAFVGYQQQTVKTANSAENLYPTGRTPSPVDLSHLAGMSIVPDSGVKAAASYPESYDLRDEGYVSPIRDQDPYGACWTFSAMASMESTAMKLLGAESPDLAEWNLAYYGYVDESTELVGFGDYSAADFPNTADFGGDDFKATAILSRWTGPVLESDVPYDGDAPNGTEADAYHLSDVMFLYYDADSRYTPVSIGNLKYALMNYGVVSVGVYADDGWSTGRDATPYFNRTTSAAYIPANNLDDLEVGSANHAVAIVGWDNDYSKDNFSTDPGLDGAWIVRNSWGTDWGDGGYFYLSYYDAVLDTGAAYVSAPADNFDNIYQYDPLGLCNMYGIPGDITPTTAWMANIFVSEGIQTLTAVSFYAPAVDTEYEISIFTNVENDDPTHGDLALYSQEGTLRTSGYRTVALDAQVYLSGGETFSIVVKLTTPGYDYPIAVEYEIDGYTDKASANPSESFFSNNGISWTDATNEVSTANICLKAFTDNITLVPAGGDLPPIDSDGEMEAFAEFKADLDAISSDILNGLGEGFVAGSLTVPGEAPLEYRSGNSVLNSGKTALDVSYDRRLSYNGDRVNGIILAAYNHQAGRYEIPGETGISDAAAVTLTEVSLADGSPFDEDGTVNGTLTGLKLMEVVVEAEVTPTSSGGGGCSLGAFVPAALLLLAPLALLRKK